MEKIKKKMEPDLHAVVFKRKVKSELSEEFLKNKQADLDSLKKGMEDLKPKQENSSHTNELDNSID